MNRMALIFPPQGDPTMPAQPLAALRGYLEQEFNDLDLLVADANIEAYDFLLQPARLAEIHRDLQKKRRLLEKKDGPTPQDMALYRTLAGVEVSAPSVIDAVAGAVDLIRSPGVLRDYRGYYHATMVINRALKLVSASVYPTTLDVGGFSMPHAIDRWTEIRRATEDCENNPSLNPFVQYYHEKLIPRLQAFSPQLIGLSLAYPTQVHQVFYLARQFSRLFPGVPVVVGGSMMPTMADGLLRCEGAFQWVYAFVTHEGEKSLAGLVRVLRKETTPDQVPGIVYRRGKGDVAVNPPGFVHDLDRLPLPDFTGYPLHLYLSPETVLPYSLGRGCHWRQCAFCCQDLVSRRAPRVKSPDTLQRELAQIKEKYGASFLYISDEGFDSNTLATLGDIIARENLGIQWSSDARLEEGWTSEKLGRAATGGCVKLWFGLESYNQRMLNKIRKGVRLSHVRPIMNMCRETRILVHFYCMFSFPGETLDEARQTIGFLLDHREMIDTAAFNTFRLHKFSDVYRRPDHYGVQLLPLEEPGEFQQDFPFETTEGMRREEAEHLNRSVREHRAMEEFQAPHVLSKAHLLLLASANRNYRDDMIRTATAFRETGKSAEPTEHTKKHTKYRVPGYINMCRFRYDPFGGTSDEKEHRYTVVYVPWQHRHLQVTPGMENLFQLLSTRGEYVPTNEEEYETTRLLMAEGLIKKC